MSPVPCSPALAEEAGRERAMGGREEAREGEKQTLVINTYRRISVGSAGCKACWKTQTDNMLLTAKLYLNTENEAI